MVNLNYYIMENGEFTEHEKTDESTFKILKDALDDATLAVLCIHPEIDIWYDDEFLFNDRFEPTLIVKNSDTPNVEMGSDILLQGRLLFASHNEVGDTTDFPKEYLEWLQSKIHHTIVDDKPVFLFRNY